MPSAIHRTVVSLAWLCIIGCSYFCFGCERHILAWQEPPTSNLYVYRADDLTNYLREHGFSVEDIWRNISTNANGTAIFISGPSTQDAHTTYVLAADRLEPLVVTSSGNESVLDDRFQPVAWVDRGSFWGGPIHFAAGGYVYAIADPAYSTHGFDPSGQYWWTAIGPGAQSSWSTHPTLDVIQIRSMSKPGEILLEFSDRFQPCRLFSFKERLYLLGNRYSGNPSSPWNPTCIVMKKTDGKWGQEKNFSIPFGAGSAWWCTGIDMQSGLVLIRTHERYDPFPYATVEWHFLNLADHRIMEIDSLAARGSSWNSPELNAKVPLLLERDFLTGRMQ